MHYKSSNFHMNVLYYVGLTLGTQELSYLRHSYIENVPYWTLEILMTRRLQWFVWAETGWRQDMTH